MKIIKNQKKLLNLNVLEIEKPYFKKNYLLNKNIEYRVRNALYIIFKFHSENKKILFIGTTLKFNKQLKNILKNTNHLFIPEKIWLNGVLSNTKSIFKFFFKKYFKKKNKNNLKFLFNIIQKKNLIIIINEHLNPTFLREFLKKRIPVISLNYNRINLNYINSIYRIKKNKKINSGFFLILKNILKNTEKILK